MPVFYSNFKTMSMWLFSLILITGLRQRLRIH